FSRDLCVLRVLCGGRFRLPGKGGPQRARRTQRFQGLVIQVIDERVWTTDGTDQHGWASSSLFLLSVPSALPARPLRFKIFSPVLYPRASASSAAEYFLI